ncbi:L-2-hydroxyglutarate oxidase [Candidatus Poriferisodalis sp.]|uniref:L-2-hydroxyglutarate oxidase n=1 Tax=Candidatus Poriferisodalis sp. TaxID=3101277 RepID=UPI003B017FAE
MSSASTSPARADLAVVGAGIIGLAAAHRFLTDHPGSQVVVCEAEERPALHQTGHNSGVLHSGVYYRPGSAKAALAVAGRSSMVEFCRERGIPHEVCGKVIVAVDSSERERLATLAERAVSNGVAAELIDSRRLGELEPHCAGIAALLVPSTGIVDYRAVCRALIDEIEAAGGELRTGTAVVRLAPAADCVRVTTTSGDLEATWLVNCAGLRCDQVAGLAGAADGYRIVPFRGEYYELVPERSHLVNNLIYPVPDPSFPFLGVHLTRMIDGTIHAGPNAVLALAREGYRWSDISRAQLREHVTNRGLWRLARRYWRTGAGEVWRSLNKAAFTRALQRLVPDIEADDLVRSPAGVRAQAMDASGELEDDFAVTVAGRSTHVLNAPSPAATSSLEIAKMIVAEIDR